MGGVHRHCSQLFVHYGSHMLKILRQETIPGVRVIAILIRRQPSELLRGLPKEPSCELYSLDAKLKLDREKPCLPQDLRIRHNSLTCATKVPKHGTQNINPCSFRFLDPASTNGSPSTGTLEKHRPQERIGQRRLHLKTKILIQEDVAS